MFSSCILSFFPLTEPQKLWVEKRVNGLLPHQIPLGSLSRKNLSLQQRPWNGTECLCDITVSQKWKETWFSFSSFNLTIIRLKAVSCICVHPISKYFVKPPFAEVQKIEKFPKFLFSFLPVMTKNSSNRSVVRMSTLNWTLNHAGRFESFSYLWRNHLIKTSPL